MQTRRIQGITRNKFQQLLLNKQAKRKKQSRFAKQNLIDLSTSSSASASLNSSAIRVPLHQDIELSKMPTMPALSPDWVELYEECLVIVKSIDDIKKQMAAEHSRRLSLVKLSEEKESERKIYDMTMIATKKIKQCQKNLAKIKNDDAQSQSESDRKTRKNVCMSLAVTIQQKTKQLRNQQRTFVEQRQKLENSTKVSFLQLATQKAYNSSYGDQIQQSSYQDQHQLEEELKINSERNQEILKIIQSIYQLNDLYKQLNNLVILQGTLLDRIDYNIQESAVNVKKGADTLERVDERQRKSKCSCVVIAVLVLAVVVLGIVLIVKWSKH